MAYLRCAGELDTGIGEESGTGYARPSATVSRMVPGQRNGFYTMTGRRANSSKVAIAQKRPLRPQHRCHFPHTTALPMRKRTKHRLRANVERLMTLSSPTVALLACSDREIAVTGLHFVESARSRSRERLVAKANQLSCLSVMAQMVSGPA